MKRHLEDSHMDAKATDNNGQDDPLSAHSHAWSRHLCSVTTQWTSSSSSPPMAAAVQSVHVDSTIGIIKLQLKTVSPSSSSLPTTGGYASRSWGLHVGGHGLGSDEDALWVRA